MDLDVLAEIHVLAIHAHAAIACMWMWYKILLSQRVHMDLDALVEIHVLAIHAHAAISLNKAQAGFEPE